MSVAHHKLSVCCQRLLFIACTDTFDIYCAINSVRWVGIRCEPPDGNIFIEHHEPLESMKKEMGQIVMERLRTSKRTAFGGHSASLHI